MIKNEEITPSHPTIFPVVFTFHLTPSSGSGLIFQTLPYLFSQLPGSLVLSTLFFTLFVFTALTSAIPLIEVVATNLMEVFNLTRKRAAILVGSVAFTFGIPSAFARTDTIFPGWEKIYGMNFLQTINSLVSIWVMPIGVLLCSLFVGWVMDKKVLEEEFMVGGTAKFFFRPWHFFMRWIVPLTIMIIIIQWSGLFDFDHLLGRK